MSKVDNKQFYLIWSPQGLTPSVVKFDTYKVCSHVCFDMAKRYPKQDFFLMKAKAHYKVPLKVKKTKLLRNPAEYTMPSVSAEDEYAPQVNADDVIVNIQIVDDLDEPAIREIEHLTDTVRATGCINHDCWCNEPALAHLRR